jgi:hypothetical protein
MSVVFRDALPNRADFNVSHFVRRVVDAEYGPLPSFSKVPLRSSQEAKFTLKNQ